MLINGPEIPNAPAIDPIIKPKPERNEFEFGIEILLLFNKIIEIISNIPNIGSKLYYSLKVKP